MHVAVQARDQHGLEIELVRTRWRARYNVHGLLYNNNDIIIQVYHNCGGINFPNMNNRETAQHPTFH